MLKFFPPQKVEISRCVPCIDNKLRISVPRAKAGSSGGPVAIKQKFKTLRVVGQGANGHHDWPGTDVTQFEKTGQAEDVEHAKRSQKQSGQHQKAKLSPLLQRWIHC